MFCQKCGAPLQPGERFCTKCGAPNEQPQQPQQPQQQAYQQPQQAPYQQYRPQQAPYQQPYAPKAPADKKKLFGLLTIILFGSAALFLLISMIGLAVKGGATAGIIISYVIAILGCAGLAVAPIFPKLTKLFVAAAGAALFVGMYGVSVGGISASVGFLFLMFGFCAFAAVCYLYYRENKIAKLIWIFSIPAGLIFIGFLLNWIIRHLFSQLFRIAVVYALFDFLFGLTILAAIVFICLYFVADNDKPAPQQARPQQPPYQGR